MIEKLLRPDEAAGVLGVSVRRVRQLIAQGEVPVIILGPRLRRIPAAALEAWAQEGAARLDTARGFEKPAV